MDDLVTLVSQTYSQNDIGEQVPKETCTEVLCSVESVTRSEWVAAGKMELQPSLCVKTNRANYEGQSKLLHRDTTYSIYRVFYPPDSDNVELYCKEEAGNG